MAMISEGNYTHDPHTRVVKVSLGHGPTGVISGLGQKIRLPEPTRPVERASSPKMTNIGTGKELKTLC